MITQARFKHTGSHTDKLNIQGSYCCQKHLAEASNVSWLSVRSHTSLSRLPIQTTLGEPSTALSLLLRQLVIAGLDSVYAAQRMLRRSHCPACRQFGKLTGLWEAAQKDLHLEGGEHNEVSQGKS